MASLYLAKLDFANAESVLKSGKDANPSSTMPDKALADIYVKTGRLRQAEKQC